MAIPAATPVHFGERRKDPNLYDRGLHVRAGRDRAQAADIEGLDV
jgi:hypothetical protein